MPAERKEIEDAKKEGVEFLFLNNITKVLGIQSCRKNRMYQNKINGERGRK